MKTSLIISIIVSLEICIFILPMSLFAVDSSSMEVTSSESMMQVMREGRVPNYLISIGAKGGYFQPFNRFGELIDASFAASLYVRYNPGLLNGLTFQFETGFIPSPIVNSDGSYVNTVFPSVGARYGISLISSLSLNMFASCGVMVNIFNGAKTSVSDTLINFFAIAGTELEFELAYHSDIAVGLSYQTPFDSAGLQGLSVYAAYSFRIGGEPRENQLRITNPSMTSVFPSMNAKYSSDMPVGSVTISNTGDDPIENIQVALFMEGVMDNPTISQERYELAVEENLIVPLFGVFNERILSRSSDQVMNAEIVIRYEIGGTTYTKRENASLMLYNKNALIWEPVERVCAFVSTDDPAIDILRSAIETEITDNEEYSYVRTNLRKAIKAFELLKSMGLEYLSDPNKPFASSSSGNAQAIDTIQFPSEFLMENRRTGDCDDCAVLYASLLESVGVPAGFIITPQHIFTMFNTGVPSENIGMVSEDPNSVILHQGYIWIPVETTFIDSNRDGFNAAWEMAVQEYRLNQSNLKLVSVQAAWQEYPPVAINSDTSQMAIPDYNLANENYNNSVLAYRQNHRSSLDRAMSVDQAAMSPSDKREAALQLIQSNQPGRAISILQEIVGDGDNDFEDYYYIGSACFQANEDMQLAIENFMQAERNLMNQQDTARYLPRIYLNISQCYNKLGNQEEQLRYYNMAKDMNEVLARRFAFLSGEETGTALSSDVTQELLPILLD